MYGEVKRRFNVMFVAVVSLFTIWVVLHLVLHSGAITSPYVIAHRGSSELAPENTEAAISKAIEQGIEFVEIDVQRTSDNILVLMHDNNVQRTTNGVGLIRGMTWEEVDSLDAGSYFSSEFRGEGVPILDSILKMVIEKDITLFLEVKNPENYPGIETQIMATIQKYQARDRVVVVSFDSEWLEVIQKREANMRVGWVCLWLGRTSHLPVSTTLHVHWAGIVADPTLVRRAHNKDCQVIAWTVNNFPLMRLMLWLGVDGITTGNPDLGMKALAPE